MLGTLQRYRRVSGLWYDANISQRRWKFLNTVIQAATKLRAFFLALFQPIRKSVTTNTQVMQTSVFLKYSSLFAFLQRQASDVAQEVQRSYIGAARMYYETGFRRYARSLGYIKVGQSLYVVSDTGLWFVGSNKREIRPRCVNRLKLRNAS